MYFWCKSIHNPCDKTFPMAPYNQKFSRESNFRYFRERFENVKICLREKLYFKKESLEVGTGIIYCCILSVTVP